MRAIALLALLVACRSKSPPPPAQAPAPSAPAGTAAQDALWKLAPEGALAGGVVTSAALARLETAHAITSSSPELAMFRDRLDGTLEDLFGLTSAPLAELGKPGFAFFVTTSGRLTIFPLGSRDKLVALTNGSKEADVDRVKDQFCKPVQGVYACSNNPALFQLVGKGDLSAQLKLVDARGDLEIAASIMGVEVAGVAQFGRGSVTLRAALKGAPPEYKQLLVNARPRTEGDRTAGFAVLDLDGYFTSLKERIPAVPIAPGLTAAAFVKSIEGPLTLTIDHGSPAIDVRLPLTDAAPATLFVGACTSSVLARFGASVTGGTCHVPVPMLGLELDTWVEGKTLRIGDKAAQPGTLTAPMSPIAKELASGAWVISVYGRGTFYGQTKVHQALDPDALPLSARGVTFLNELGFGVRSDGDVIRAVATVRTLWSNPDELVTKLAAIPVADIMQGNTAAQAKALADAYPRSPFALDLKTGSASIMLPTATIGLFLAVAVPAFLDYMKKSKRSEADLQLGKLRKNLEGHAATTGAFPKGTIGPSPAKPCCGSTPNNKCFDPAAWKAPLWTGLDFKLDEPHFYRYSYASPDGKKFIVTAASDLDCNGDEAEWVMSGTIDARGHASIEITPPAPGSY
jgi:hypothetical protein